ncbi:MAG: hypothetical protein ACRDKL_00070 [Solirubrobacteraceae bacterium]
MASRSRSVVEQQERAQGALRALYLGELAGIRQERAEALRRAERQLDRLARLLHNAHEAGIGLSEIGRVVGLSRQTLYQLRARYSENVGDVRLAVLQATVGGTTVKQIVSAVGRTGAEVEAVLVGLEAEGWVRRPEPDDFLDDLGGPAGPPAIDWLMTVEGVRALESWSMVDEGSGTVVDEESGAAR